MTVPTVPLLEAVQDVSAGNTKIPQSAFLDWGQLAIVDQGQQLIAGYSNDAGAAVKASLPVIVFGDHTRAVKFIDFPFAMGADGVKVLHTREGFDPKFVYRYLQSRSIPSAGYSRHFKFLKEISVPKPPLIEQRRVAAILDHADLLRTKRRQVLTHLDTLPQSIFGQLFGDPLVSTGSKLWKPLKEWIDPERPITYGILKPGPDVDGGIPYVRVADMQDRGIRVQNVRRTTKRIASEYRRSTLRRGDLLMSIRGHVGRFAFVPESLDGANITQDSARLAVENPLAAAYVRAAMESPSVQHWMARRTKGAAVQGINLGDLRELPLYTPPDDVLVSFARSIARVEAQREAASRVAALVGGLFASLQSRAFRGEL